jgi:type IV pilus assembly protein PilF
LIRATLVALLGLCVLAACAPVPTKPSEQGMSETHSARNRARIHAELGAAYYGAGRYAVAIEELQEALKADPAYVPAINQLGLVYLALGQEPQAMAQLERALKIDPNDSSVNNNYGMLLCQRGREKDGLRHLRKVLADPLYPLPAAANVNAGICFKNSGDFEQAETTFRKALALSPNQPQALYHLADLAFARGDFAAARDLITRHAQLTDADAEALWLAARIENRLGNRNALASYGAQLNRRFPNAAQTRAFNEGSFQ